MTEEDIITEDWIEYKNNATKYLEMHSQYATRKAIQIAIEKQIPKEPIDKIMYKECPKCGSVDLGRYCMECGQAIKYE